MPQTQAVTTGTKKLIDQSADGLAENSTGTAKRNASLRQKLRQIFSF